MAQCMYKMVLDVAERDCLQSIVARQGDNDTRVLRLQLLSFGEPIYVEESSTVTLNAKNAQEEVCSFKGKVNGDGTLTLPLNAWILKTVGSVLCDVSVFDTAGGRLTTPCFEVEVVASVAEPDALPGDTAGEESITARILAQEKVLSLTPTETPTGEFVLAPVCNRKYALDLSGSKYSAPDGTKNISLQLPREVDEQNESWVLIYCHAPLADNEALIFNWGNVEEVLFLNGSIPTVTKGDFDIICTYSKLAAKWQVGVVQYGAAGEGV